MSTTNAKYKVTIELVDRYTNNYGTESTNTRELYSQEFSSLDIMKVVGHLQQAAIPVKILRTTKKKKVQEVQEDPAATK